MAPSLSGTKDRLWKKNCLPRTGKGRGMVSHTTYVLRMYRWRFTLSPTASMARFLTGHGSVLVCGAGVGSLGIRRTTRSRKNILWAHTMQFSGTDGQNKANKLTGTRKSALQLKNLSYPYTLLQRKCCR